MTTPLWILCNPRSGSSLLCDLLNNSSKFPPFNHQRLVERRGPLEQGLAFNEWLRLFFKPYGVSDFELTPPPHTKCIYHQFVDIFGDKDANYIEKHIPDIKFVWLHRKNQFDQTISLYFAKTLFNKFNGRTGKSSSYHIYHEKDLEEYLNTTVKFDQESIVQMYKEVQSYKHNWDRFLGNKKFLPVYYEDLIDNPTNQIKKILEFCNIQCDDIKTGQLRTYKMTRPEQPMLIKKLKTLLAPIHL